jgi:hypothetical protein
VTRPVLTEFDGLQIVGNAELKDEVLKSSWVDIPVNTTDWLAGGGGFAPPRVKKVGNLAWVQGLVTCIKAGTSSNLLIATLVGDYRPVSDGSVYQQYVIVSGGVAVNTLISYNTSGSIIALNMTAGQQVALSAVYQVAPA